MKLKYFFTTLLKRKKSPLKHHIILAAATLGGVAILQLVFAAVYLGAFHSPAAHNLPVAIVGDESLEPLAESFEQKSNHAYKTTLVATRDEAEKQLKTQQIFAIYHPSVPQGTVIIASANGKSLAQPLTTSLTQLDASYQQQARQAAAAQQNQTVANAPITEPTIADIAPLPDSDKNGVSLFYIAFSAVFGGYLAAVAVNLVRGKRAFSRRLAVIRIAGFALFSIITSIGVAIIATQSTSAVSSDHFWTVVGVASLTTFGVSLVASSLVSLLGVLGTALVIVLFVIFGTPASGGPLPLPLTGAGPWHLLAPFLPTGAGFDSLRQAIYFDGIDVMKHLWVLIGYVIIGTGVLLTYGARRSSVSTFEDDIATEYAQK